MANNIKIFCIIFILTLVGCASVPNYKDSDLLPIGDLYKIEGEYKNIPTNVEYRSYKTFDNVIDWRKKKSDTSKIAFVKVKVLNEKFIQFSFINEQSENKVIKVKYKIEQNGFVTLKNRNFKLTGLPYIFGGYEINKVQLGITKENQLILNGTKVDEGAVLLILPATIPKSDFVYKFEKI